MARRNSLLGAPRAGDVNPIWGAGVGTAVSTGVPYVVAYAKPDWLRWANLIGAGAGVLGSSAFFFSKRGKAAAITGIVSAVLNGGLRMLLDETAGGAIAEKAATAAMPPAPTSTQGHLGIVEASRTTGLRGLGAIEATPTTALQGSLGTMTSERTTALQGPPVHMLGAHYGATIFG